MSRMTGVLNQASMVLMRRCMAASQSSQGPPLLGPPGGAPGGDGGHRLSMAASAR